jgi:predicted RNA-binding protein (virulence factor B family)
MALKVGDYNEMIVIRETPYGYILGLDSEEVFLHHKQAKQKYVPNDKVKVFVYFDGQRRLTATTQEPYISGDKAGFLKVVGINDKIGVFLDIGIGKDLLLSIDDLPFFKSEWPQVDDLILAKIKPSKHQITAKLISRDDVKKYFKPSNELKVGDFVTAYNIYKTEEGNVFASKEGHTIFVFFTNMRKRVRLGEEAEIKITLDKGDFHYAGTMIEQKELMIDNDAKRILEFLKAHNGNMKFTDKSDPESIRTVFNMSKSAFKRALGTLYKEKQIILEDDKTRLLKPLNPMEK